MAARLAIAALVLLLAAASVHADDVITVEGLEQLEGLVKKHKFLVVEVSVLAGHGRARRPGGGWGEGAAAGGTRRVERTTGPVDGGLSACLSGCSSALGLHVVQALENCRHCNGAATAPQSSPHAHRRLRRRVPPPPASSTVLRAVVRALQEAGA